MVKEGCPIHYSVEAAMFFGSDEYLTFLRYGVLSHHRRYDIVLTGVIFTKGTVEPRYNDVLGTMKITLLYQVSHYIRVKKTKKYKELGPAKLPCYNRVLLYPTSL